MLCLSNFNGFLTLSVQTSSSFSRFDELAPADIQVICLNLPGHRGRRDASYLPDVPALLETFVSEAIPKLLGRPLAIYGHCMGGHLAYEIALRLEQYNLQASVG
jgi:surfactin synthase thioesterase subunit